jgi:cell fate regulator YaaT (PSP1 superfamily)
MIYEIKFLHGEQNVIVSTPLDLALKTEVIIKTTKGKQFGRILRRLPEGKIETTGTLIAEANAQDVALRDKMEEESSLAKATVDALVRENQLNMQIVAVAYTLDRSQLFISFTAESRVDFRQLLRDLSETFHTRIELRQIGVRDAAKYHGGLGPCGRPLCCSEFLYEFPTVSIKMAKNQQLGLNQAKLNGMCGRLMCCLSYEDEFYQEAARDFPDFGEQITTAEGPGRVIGLNIMARTIKIRFEDMVRDYSIEELTVKR